ncbi:MAG: ATP-binding protein [Bacteroidia bacterium]|nr:ATP-binding protein [Bacteroidia bacterium]
MNDSRAIVILGPRQTGKTYFVENNLLNLEQDDTLYLNGDDMDVRELFDRPTVTKLKTIIGSKKNVVIDEAQRIKDIGICIKIITDRIPGVKVFATGSSSLEIANTVNEPLTGRKWEFRLLPFSFQEMVDHHGLQKEIRMLEHRLIYGYYPDVVNHPDRAATILKSLAESYLYKDILYSEPLKYPDRLEKVLRALALQIGSVVSLKEVGDLCGMSPETVERYISLLEKSFVIFRLRPYSGNARNEIKKMNKIYFYDNGIRNALIRNFQPISFRVDIGQLWENFIVAERLKWHYYNHDIIPDFYFWRNTSQQEVDWLEVFNQQVLAMEIKFSDRKKIKFPGVFMDTYKPFKTYIVHKENFHDILMEPPAKYNIKTYKPRKSKA